MEAENLTLNPIDVVEEVVYQKNWSFSRAADHELVAELASKWCKYRLYFSWSENISAMSFTVTFDFRFPEYHYERAYELLGLINERLWIGHFDITSKNGIPAYRHTVLSSNNYILHKQLEDLLDIGIYECEKYYPSFQQVLFEDISPEDAIKFSNFEIIGQA